MLALVFIVCVINLVSATKDDERNFGHERVLENVMKNYREALYLVRPAKNTSAEVGLNLNYIKHFDKTTGRLTAGFWLRQRWVDSRLSWEDSAVKTISVPPAKIWKPDWRLFNSMDYMSKLDDTVLPVVSPDGTVIWVPLAEYTVACAATDEYQKWECNIKIGSWVYNAHQLNLKFFDDSNLIDIAYYEEELYGFHLEALPGEVVTKVYDCCPDEYQTVQFRFLLSVVEGGVASGTTSLMASLITLFIGCVIPYLY